MKWLFAHVRNVQLTADEALVLVGWVASGALSLVATFNGAHTLVEGSFFYALGLTLALQSLLAAGGVLVCDRSRKRIIRLAAGFFVVAGMSASIFVAAPYVWVQIQAASYGKARLETDIRSHLAPLRDLAVRYQTLEAATSYGAQLSSDLATIEATQGGTCEARAPRGQGPRYRRRMEDEQRLNSFAQHVAQQEAAVADLLTDADEVILQGRNRISGNMGAAAVTEIQAAVRSLLMRGRGLLADPALNDIDSWAEQRIAIGDAGWEVEGARVYCRDPQLAQRLAEIRTALANLPQLHDENITVFRADDPMTAATHVRSDLIALLLGGEAEGGWSSYAALLVTAAIDALHIILGMLLGVLRSGKSGPQNPLDGVRVRRPRIDEAAVRLLASKTRRGLQPADALEPFAQRNGRRLYFALPDARSVRKQCANGGLIPCAWEIIRRLEGLGLAELREENVTAARIRWRPNGEELKERFGARARYAIYEAPKGLLVSLSMLQLEASPRRETLADNDVADLGAWPFGRVA